MRRSAAAHTAAATSAWGAFILRAACRARARRGPLVESTRFRLRGGNMLDTSFSEAALEYAPARVRAGSSTRRLAHAPARVRAGPIPRRLEYARHDARPREFVLAVDARLAGGPLPSRIRRRYVAITGGDLPGRRVRRGERTEPGSLGGGALTRLALLGRGNLDLDDGARAPVVACARPFTSGSCSRSRGRRRARGRRRRRACCRASPCPR